MSQMIVVTQAFAGYAKGDQVTHEAEVKSILRSEHASHVVRSTGKPETAFSGKEG